MSNLSCSFLVKSINFYRVGTHKVLELSNLLLIKSLNFKNGHNIFHLKKRESTQQGRLLRSKFHNLCNI